MSDVDAVSTATTAATANADAGAGGNMELLARTQEQNAKIQRLIKVTGG